MSYVKGVIMSHRASETELTNDDRERLEDIIDNGATPLTELEMALVEALNGTFVRWCSKLTAMANYAKTLNGYRSIQYGIPWKSDSDKLRDEFTLDKELDLYQHSHWTMVDEANYYCSLDDENSKYLGRLIFKNIEMDEEMAVDQERFEKEHPKKRGLT